MKLSEFFLTRGPAALAKLADDTHVSVGYLTRLAYTKSLPSLPLANRLVRASGEVLTLADLAEPVPVAEMRRRMRGPGNHAITLGVSTETAGAAL